MKDRISTTWNLYKWKIYFCAKIHEDWTPYFPSQKEFNVNTATIEDIRNVLLKYISNVDVVNDMVEEFRGYFTDVQNKIMFSWKPSFLKTVMWEKERDRFLQHIEKLSRWTATFSNDKQWPLAFFTMYRYRDKK